jgi:protein-tyrosine phosphatase
MAVQLACSSSPFPDIRAHTVGLIAICPRASPMTEKEASLARKLKWIPDPLFDVLRWLDRRGGLESASIERFIGKGADKASKQMQSNFNDQSRTPTFRRIILGMLPTAEGVGGLQSEEEWASLDLPLLLIGGESDTTTTPDNVMKIADIRANPSPSVLEERASFRKHMTLVKTLKGKDNTDRDFRHQILPAPATHGLMYVTATYRIVGGIISSYIANHIDQRLSPGWQLQHLSTEGKWDVKNLQKWQAVDPVSPIISEHFRAMKTLREVDDSHNPTKFAQNWGPESHRSDGVVTDVIDISHETPVYDPAGLEVGGVHYHKFPTVSKFPPTQAEVSNFNALVDEILANNEKLPGDEKKLIGVHCHYGYNRTGFFVCSYLIEREGFGVQQALDLYKERRPDGIRHAHFVDTLFVRYCVGLKRAPTL